MARNQLYGRRCSFESLEGRQMLAGDVSANINSKGILIIKGDINDNNINITATQVIANGTTKLNGVTAGTLSITGLTGRIEVDLNGGTHDQITVGGLPAGHKGLEIENTETVLFGAVTVNRKLKIEGVADLAMDSITVNGKTELKGTDGGALFIIGEFGASTFNGSLEIDLKNDGRLDFIRSTVNGTCVVEDVKDLSIYSATFNGKTEFEGTKGDDLFIIGQFGASTFNGSVKIDLEDGINSLTFNQSTVASNTEIEGGRDKDSVSMFGSTFKSLELELGDGENGATLNNSTVTGKTEIEGGSGKDTMGIFNSTFNSLEVKLGKSDDIMGFSNSKVTGKAVFETGDGDDTFTIVKQTLPTTFGILEIDMGKGNDLLTIQAGVVVTTKTRLDGGPGTQDRLLNASTTLSPANLKIKNFERFV